MLCLFPNKTERETPYWPRHSRKPFHVPHCPLPLKDQPHAGENEMLRETKSATNYSKEERTIHISQVPGLLAEPLYWIHIVLHITATELKWNMKRNCRGVIFIYFGHLLPKMDMQWLFSWCIPITNVNENILHCTQYNWLAVNTGKGLL